MNNALQSNSVQPTAKALRAAELKLERKAAKDLSNFNRPSRALAALADEELQPSTTPVADFTAGTTPSTKTLQNRDRQARFKAKVKLGKVGEMIMGKCR